MFKYVSDISEIAQGIIANYCANFNTALDCTLGNGYDTDFLKDNFQKVYSFDIQEDAVKKYKVKNVPNVFLVQDSHHKLDSYISEDIDCIMYNLGYLPGGDKTVTTLSKSTIISIKQGLNIMSPGAIMTISVYCGHDEGKKEKEAIFSLVKNLSKKDFGVMIHSFLNRSEDAPVLIVIEKNL